MGKGKLWKRTMQKGTVAETHHGRRSNRVEKCNTDEHRFVGLLLWTLVRCQRIAT